MTDNPRLINVKHDVLPNVLPKRTLLRLSGYGLLSLLTACSPTAQHIISTLTPLTRLPTFEPLTAIATENGCWKLVVSN